MPSSTNLTVNQSSPNGIINWQSFNIANGEKTTFVQPSSSATTLNRVNIGNPSTIAGQLSANGNLILVNPSGIFFAKGSQVNANSLLATPSDITNANFLAGNMKFDRPSADPNARVVNAGTITVAQNGLAALVAPGVANSGVIRAKLGKVILAGAETYTLDFYGDGLINFDIGQKVAQAPLGADGKQVASLVSNTGQIFAAGGTVLLTADAVAGLLTNVIDAGGTVAAPNMAQATGTVRIDGQANGALVDGTIGVSGLSPGQTGGTAIVTGSTATLAPTAKIYARGNAGGGTVEVGGGPHGADPKVNNAQYTTIATGALIDASATSKGNGGTVSVWSDNTTNFGGTILAKGGPNGGNGGWVETSGHQVLDVGSLAKVDASAAKGAAGSWLLDPDSDITIQSGGTISCSSGTCSPLATDMSTSSVDADSIQSALNGGTSVTVYTYNPNGTGTGNITVASPISVTTATQAVSLTLDAGVGYTALTGGAGGTGTGSIAINSPISDSGSPKPLSLVLNAGGGIAFDNTVTILGALSATAGINGAGDITQTSALSVGGASSFMNNSTGGIALNTATNSLQGVVSFDTTAGDASLLNSPTAQLGASTVNGALTVEVTVGGIEQTGGVLKVTGASRFAADSSGGEGIVLNDAGNVLKGPITLSGSGNAILVNSGGTQLAQSTIGPNLTVEDTTGSISQTGALTVSGGGVGASFKTDAANQTIMLNGATNVLSVPVTLNTAGGDASLTNSGGTNLAASTIHGNLSVEDTTGNISQSGTLTVTGTSSFTTDTSTKTIALNTTNALTGAVSLTTNGADANASLSNSVSGTGTVLGTSMVGGGLTVTDSDAFGITQTGALTVGGTSSFTAKTAAGSEINLTAANALTGAITLDNGTQTGGVSLSNAVTGTGTVLASVKTGGNLTVTDGDAFGITQSGVLTVGGTSMFTATTTGANINLGTSANALAGAVSLTTGGNASLQNGATIFGNSSVGGTLGITSSGTIGQLASTTITATTLTGSSTGNASFNQANSINNLGTFATTTGGGNGAFTLVDTVPLTLNGTALTTGTGAVSINDGANMLTVSSPIYGTGTISLTADTMSLTAQVGGSTANTNQATKVTLAPATATQAISLGANASTGLALTATALNNIRSTDVTVGPGGAVTLDGAFTASASFGTDAGPGGFSLSGSSAEISVNPTLQGGFSIVAGTITQNVALSVNGVLALTSTGSGALTLPFGLSAPNIELSSAGAISQSAGIIDPTSLSVVSGGPVSMLDANTVDSLAFKVTGTGNSFAFNDTATPLTITTVAQMSGPAIVGGTTANGNIILQTTTSGDISIVQPINAGTVQIGLSSAGAIGESGSGGVIGGALEALAANSVTLSTANNQIGTALATGLVSGKVTNSGQSFFLVVDYGLATANLQVDTVGVTAGSLSLTSQPGVQIAGGAAAITLEVNGGGPTGGNLLLNAPVNANGGSSNLGATPGQIALASQEGVVSQNANGPIVGSALLAIGNTNNTPLTGTNNAVNLTAAANLVGTSAAPGQLAGNVITQGNFAFVDTAANGLETANLTLIGNVKGITTPATLPHDISLATTAGSITVTNGNGLTSNGGAIDLSVAPNGNYGIINQGAIASSGGNIVLIGDFLSLGGSTGTVNAGAGTVVLGPATTSLGITLGSASNLNVSLGLRGADFTTITTTGMVQVGYRTAAGGTSFSGNIGIGGAGITVPKANTPALSLVTGTGSISQTAALTFTGGAGTLGLLSGGGVTLTSANDVATVAG
ncbi:MAG TPA: filamentous hemagglutinin N-terminal domain-containing protein, partial [Stellaceae bacterium]|nr:filamentous hemagglutinin N-terminal domain-containing protein [Stellaceae bacterium]